jgi:DNA-binding MarR family transcriptional regulator
MKHYDARSYSVQDSIGYLMRRGASLMRDQLDAAFAGHDFTFVQWATLMLVRENPALTPGDLCRDLRHDSGAFTRILDHLEARGLLRRERSDEDRRVVQLRVTAEGRRVVNSLLPVVVEQLNDALADFTAEEVAMLAKLLRRLIARLQATAAVNADPHRRVAKP